MNINVFGSTGVIGSKTLKLLKNNFPLIKINLLSANNNYKKLIQQAIIYKPKYIYIKNDKQIEKIKSKIDKKIIIIKESEIFKYLNDSKSDLTILSISGYEALYFLKPIIFNTKYLGVVNKECIVSAGHLIKKLLKRNKTKIFPIDSEHFSLKKYFDNTYNNIDYNKIYITASGGPFYKKKWQNIKNASFKDAINHPKWKMGYKNSIDSATLANKCLELVEAHYLFDIPYKKLDILLHPQALVHSIIDLKNCTTELNYFYHNMDIPIFNFLNLKKSKSLSNYSLIKNYIFAKNLALEFNLPNKKQYPILSIFNKINKNDPKELIKFNIANEFSVNLFKNKKINFGNIHKIIDQCMNIKLNKPVNNIENVIDYHKVYNQMLINKYENI